MQRQHSFAKLSATGNDFILFDNRNGQLSAEETALFQSMCRRQTGIGADGILLIEEHGELHFALRYFNADGHESPMCGNGARAAAFYAFHHGIAPIHSRFDLGGHEMEAIVEGKAVSLLMHAAKDVRPKPGVLEHEGFSEGAFMDTGVPHYVLLVDDVDAVDVAAIGAYYCAHSWFQPAGTNVDFMHVNVLGNLEIRTWERGVNAETLSCGSGALACATTAVELLDKKLPATIQTRGGTLTISEDDATGRPRLHGQVRMVYRGEVFREALR